MASYEVQLSTALPRPLAAVRRAVPRTEISAVIRDLLGEVWRFLADNKIRSTGHNVGIYDAVGERDGDVLMDATFGVEVHEVIPASDQIVATATPAGRVATTVHWGEYTRLGEAHDAVQAWCRANGHRITRTCWEVYGDWFDDWAKVRTDVFYLLEAETGPTP
jgi:effector-binding domain-containing protein